MGRELPGAAGSASVARGLVRSALAAWEVGAPTRDTMVLLVSELVTNAVVHAGTSVRLECRHEGDALLATVSDRYPGRTVAVRDDGRGRGLRLVRALSDEWGSSYRRDRKTVWFRLALASARSGPCAGRAEAVRPRGARRPEGPSALPRPAGAGGTAWAEHGAANPPAPANSRAAVGGSPDEAIARPHTEPPEALPTALARGARRRSGSARGGGHPAAGASPHVDAGWVTPGTVSFLAEASDLLTGQLDEDRVAALAGQLLVPRFADWCAVWLEDPDRGVPPRLARVWHHAEEQLDELRRRLASGPPATTRAADGGLNGHAVRWFPPFAEVPAAARGRSAVACRLIAGGRAVGTLALGRAGRDAIPDEVLRLVEDFARRVALSVVSARRYAQQATISQVLQRGLLPRGEAALPHTETAVVYEPVGENAYAGGDFYDVFRAGPDRWCFALGDVCGKGPEAAVVTGLARPVLRLLAREGYGVPGTLDRLNREVGEQTRFLSLVYGELVPRDPSVGGGLRCTVASAGHPPPLLREAGGAVRAAVTPQLLLGIDDHVHYESQTFTLAPGETLLCVTDGVTERRSGSRQFDDHDGLAAVFAECAGRDARGTAEHIRRAVHDFGTGEPTDDLALLVLRATGPGAPDTPAIRPLP
ncbi:hypothetical protein E0L36_02875 [Streptomyces sp. AJS327]|uniref:SpoIIE family protein phosphatase n=1 Tax=Streptomyces sp. AJS327 TaxID=2545265 RepID=UPI0015DDE88B|nr:SpoIIE family protein phosphatase [Streptomyces sp. AJS327]MBA0049875.1 hypothetical protein [Streptomyces sp. AJS327]